MPRSRPPPAIIRTRALYEEISWDNSALSTVVDNLADRVIAASRFNHSYAFKDLLTVHVYKACLY